MRCHRARTINRNVQLRARFVPVARQPRSGLMTEPRPTDSLFRPGENCCAVAHADRAAFLVDGAAYFRAFMRGGGTRGALDHRSLGWDFDSRTALAFGDDHRGPGHAGRLPERARAAAPQAAGPRARLGLPDDLRRRPRVLAALRLELEAAPARALPLRRHAIRSPARITRRSSSSTTGSPSSAASTSPAGAGIRPSIGPTTRGASRTASRTRRSTTLMIAVDGEAARAARRRSRASAGAVATGEAAAADRGARRSVAGLAVAGR